MSSYTVKPGDNLTRIARRFGVAHWREIYHHPRNADFKRKRPDPNLIFPGDVLFIPGQEKPVPVIDLGETEIIVTIPGKEDDQVKNLGDREREQLLQDAKDALPDDWKPWADEALKYASWGLTVAQLGELVSQTAAVGAWAMVSPLSVAIRSTIAWVAAWETNEKMYGLRAAAYATTAWAFGRAKPSESPEMMRRFREFSPDNVIRDRQEAWRESASRQWQYWQLAYQRQKISKKAMQAAIKLEGIARAKNASGTPKQKVCLVLLKSYESEFRPGINLESWRDGYSVLYPR